MQRDSGLIAVLLLVGAMGCGARSTFDFETATALPEPDGCGVPEGTCNTRRCDPPVVGAEHVATCSTLAFPTNPPTSGPHYPIWGLFKTYDQPLARGFYLHNAEHSGIVLLHNCAQLPDDATCDALVAELKTYAADAPADPKCVEPTRNRLIVTPDPLLDVPFAAVAWGHSLKADCFDPEAVDAFVAAHYGQNYEDLCGGGIDPTDPESGIPLDCGR